MRNYQTNIYKSQVHIVSTLSYAKNKKVRKKCSSSKKRAWHSQMWARGWSLYLLKYNTGVVWTTKTGHWFGLTERCRVTLPEMSIQGPFWRLSMDMELAKANFCWYKWFDSLLSDKVIYRITVCFEEECVHREDSIVVYIEPLIFKEMLVYLGPLFFKEIVVYLGPLFVKVCLLFFKMFTDHVEKEVRYSECMFIFCLHFLSLFLIVENCLFGETTYLKWTTTFMNVCIFFAFLFCIIAGCFPSPFNVRPKKGIFISKHQHQYKPVSLFYVIYIYVLRCVGKLLRKSLFSKRGHSLWCWNSSVKYLKKKGTIIWC